ncbi:germination protein YpeB [Peribacillus saganii]|uniref:Germination protein YpeB n=1 Tax=Peribacillus saganii TaxID=2303992 RepID=A0A372LPK4_9BACI|nr:germination protein YpeB [Peribacillus saganii]RFU68516.1 germination protein YpeB [Peribacillus saganii]
MIRNIIIGALSIALIGTAFWGYQERQAKYQAIQAKNQERQAKNEVLVHAENNYQRAFHDLSYQLDILHDKIGTSLAMNSRSSLSPCLTDVWRITSEAQNDVGELPLSLMAFSKTEEFLSQIGDFSYRTAIRDLEKEPLTDKEYSKLQSLYQQSTDIQTEIRKVQHTVLQKNLKWMDVEMALSDDEEKSDNTIVDGFKTVEKKVSGYGQANEMDPTLASYQQKEENYKNLTGKEISKKEAASIAKRYAKAEKGTKVKVEENKKGSEFDFYSVSLTDARKGSEVNMDITKKGGYPIWFINTRDVNKSKLSLNEGSSRATEFLKENKFENFELYESAQYDNVGLFNFVTVEQGARVYPDSVKVKIALDDGSIIGFSADEFLKSNKKREIGKPVVSEEAARGKISPKVQVMEHRLSVINNNTQQEVLCHEFLGTIGDDTYRIFINAKTGDEEKVEKMKNAEPMYENIV